MLRRQVVPARDAASLVSQWRPRLLAFLAEKRRADPVRSSATFCPDDRAEYEIVGAAMRRFRATEGSTFLSVPHRVPVVEAAGPGLTAAAEVFGPLVVALSPDEWEEWRAFAASDRDAEPWTVSASWSVTRGRLSPHEMFGEAARAAAARVRETCLRRVPDGCEPWVCSEFVFYGPLAGGARSELWSWDGSRATRVAADFGTF